MSSSQGFGETSKIVTLDSPKAEVLNEKTEDIQEGELEIAQEIAQQLYAALEPHFPAAGLAAPQIGVSKSIFIFSYDRDPKNLEVVVNPSFEPIGDTKIEGWEGCFSARLTNGGSQLAKIPRYEKIRVRYTTLEGKQVEKILVGFAAKVFQHEYDHLQGITCVSCEGAVVKNFLSREEMQAFLQKVKEKDSLRYQKPIENL